MTIDPGPTVGGPVDDSGRPATGSVDEFLRELRALRVSAGAPSYRTLARATGLPRSTVHDALNAHNTPSLDTTLAIVRALQGDTQCWRERWIATRRDDHPADDHPAGDRPPDDDARTPPADSPSDALEAIVPSSALASTELDTRAVVLQVVPTRDPIDGRRRRRTLRTGLLVGLVALLLVAAGFTAGRLTGPTCTNVGLYQLQDDSRLLTADGTLITDVARNAIVQVASADHGNYRSRVLAVLMSTGQQGWIDETKIEFVANACR